MMAWSAGLARPNDARQQVATLEAEQVVLLAIGSGACVVVALCEPCDVLQMLGPEADEVSCVGWCVRTRSLAAGAGTAVTVYNRLSPGGGGVATAGGEGGRGDWHWEQGVRLDHDGPVFALSWTRAAGAARALWVSAGAELLLWTHPDEGADAPWSVAWRRALSQPAVLLASSCHGEPLLASAGGAERLAKVWHPQPPDDPEAAERPRGRRRAGAGSGASPPSSFSFAYLPHPCAVLSLEWRAPTRASLAFSSGGRRGEEEASVLLSLCADGTPRLWLMTRDTPDAPPRFSLCASLVQEVPASGIVSEGSGRGSFSASHHGARLALWLHPSAARLFHSPSASSAAASGALQPASPSHPRSPYQPAPSPLLGLDAGVPALRPSMRERHDYVLAVRPDGTVVVFLVHGLSAHPRCSPKVMVWASLPQALPPCERYLAATGYCYFEAAANPLALKARGAAGAEADRLPTEVTLVTHSVAQAIAAQAHACVAPSSHEQPGPPGPGGDGGEEEEQWLRRYGGGGGGGGNSSSVAATEAPFRRITDLSLSSINVERSHSGARLRQKALGGHGAAAAVLSVAAHPTLPLVASLDSTGDVLLWACPILCGPPRDAASMPEGKSTPDPTGQHGGTGQPDGNGSGGGESSSGGGGGGGGAAPSGVTSPWSSPSVASEFSISSPEEEEQETGARGVDNGGINRVGVPAFRSRDAGTAARATTAAGAAAAAAVGGSSHPFFGTGMLRCEAHASLGARAVAWVAGAEPPALLVASEGGVTVLRRTAAGAFGHAQWTREGRVPVPWAAAGAAAAPGACWLCAELTGGGRGGGGGGDSLPEGGSDVVGARLLILTTVSSTSSSTK